MCGLVLEEYDYDWTEYPDQGDDWDDGEPWFDCGWVRGMGCTKAGSEECDWECPERANLEKGLRLTQARLAKRSKKQ
jgi:hypothetical protein